MAKSMGIKEQHNISNNTISIRHGDAFFSRFICGVAIEIVEKHIAVHMPPGTLTTVGKIRIHSMFKK